MSGFWELIVLLIILVIVFGARRLPALGEAVGRSIDNFKRTRNTQTKTIEVSRDNSAADKNRPDPGPT